MNSKNALKVLAIGCTEDIKKISGVDLLANTGGDGGAQLQNYDAIILSDSVAKPEREQIILQLSKIKPKRYCGFISRNPEPSEIAKISSATQLFGLWPEQNFSQIKTQIDGLRIKPGQDILLEPILGLTSDESEPQEVDKNREKKLERALKRVSGMNAQAEALQRVLVSIHMAATVGEVETLLNEALQASMGLQWLRIFFRWHEHLEAQLARVPELKHIKVPLLIGTRHLGHVVFARATKGFSKSEEDFAKQVAEGVALTIDRLQKLDQAEDLKREWESTFDAISEPLCLTDENFVIQKTNKAFSEVTGRTYKNLIGLNAFEAFIGSSTPTRIMESNPLKIERYTRDKVESEIYNVTTQKIRTKESESPILMVIFRNITEEQRLEKQMFESAKMAELGTVGSSIAHELNNPLGGVISFLQLIKMDSPEGDPVRSDIIEMERAGVRCKEIIENLLGFTRRPDSDLITEYNLYDVLVQALRVIEIKTSALGIRTKIEAHSKEIWMHGHPGLMTQAFGHLLQYAVNGILTRTAEDSRFIGEIKLSTLMKEESVEIEITDNGIPGQVVALTLANQIIDEHKGRIEISSQPKMGNLIKVSLNNV